MVRMVVKAVIGNYRYVGLFCNTIDEMVSPMFESRVRFRDWLQENMGHEESQWEFWDREAYAWLLDGDTPSDWVLKNEADEHIWEEA